MVKQLSPSLLKRSTRSSFRAGHYVKHDFGRQPFTRIPRSVFKQIDNVFFTSKNAQNFRARVRGQHPLRGTEMMRLPSGDYLHAASPEKFAWFRDLIKELDPLTGGLTSDGFLDEKGCVGSFGALRTVLPGIGMTPASLQAVSTVGVRRQAGLPDHPFIEDRAFHDETKQILADLMKLTLRPQLDVVIPIPAKSSTGFTHFHTDRDGRDLKKQIMTTTLQHFSPIAQLLASDPVAAAKIGVCACCANVYRQQNELVELRDGEWYVKDREANDLDFARSGGSLGSRTVANRDVYDTKGRLVEDFKSGRLRNANGYSTAYNAAVSTFFQSCYAYYGKEYAFTWSHKGAEDIRRKVAKYNFVIDVDVKEHDQSYSADLLEFFYEELRQYVSPELLEWIRMGLQAPYFSPEVHAFGYHSPYGPLWIADPRLLASYICCLGLPSGHAINSHLAKLCMTAVYLAIINRITKDVRQNLVAILKGEYQRYAILNMGDDCLLLFRDQYLHQALIHQFERAESDPRLISNHFKVLREHGGTFLGMALTKNKRGDVSVIPNIKSYVVRFLAPERGILSQMRPFWAYGWRIRKKFYTDAPLFGAVDAIVNDTFRSHFGLSLDATISKYEKDPMLSQDRSVVIKGPLTLIDQEVLLNPDKLHYQYTREDVSPWLYDQFITQVPVEVTNQFLKEHCM